MVKGIAPSIRALAQLPEMRLLVAGDGPRQPQLQAQAVRAGLGERIRFLGRLNATTLATYYRAADFVLLYSGFEGLSHVLLEALSYGTPVLASDILGNRELVHDGVNGLLIPYETEEAAASARIVTAVHAATAPGRRAQLASVGLLEPERYTFARHLGANGFAPARATSTRLRLRAIPLRIPPGSAARSHPS